MILAMKLLATLFAACVSMGLASGEMRTYTSADGKKSFRGELLSYEEKSSKVQVRTSKGRVVTFSEKLLSEEDREFIKSQGPVLQARKSLSVKSKHASKRTAKNKPPEGEWCYEKYDHWYQISVGNSRQKLMKDVEVHYTFFVERNRREYEGKIEVIEGSATIDLILANSEEQITTKKVNLELWSDNPVMPKGGGGGC